jgi:hypothetical protein
MAANGQEVPRVLRFLRRRRAGEWICVNCGAASHPRLCARCEEESWERCSWEDRDPWEGAEA